MERAGWILVLVFWGAVAAAGCALTQRAIQLARARQRLMGDDPGESAGDPQTLGEPRGRLRRWLIGAGIESPGAGPLLIAASCFSVVVGALLALGPVAEWAQAGARETRKFPGVLGSIVAPLYAAGPALFFILVAFAPWVWVRSLRRRRLQQVEQDLPLFLETLVTLGEAGLGFDEALSRVLEISDKKKPLTKAFRSFQSEVLSGDSRVRAFWRLRGRLPTVSVRSFVSAVLQSEQTGGRMAEILRYQAVDALSRRRLKAMELAQALQVKLVLPMFVCFMPGIFVVTLGPVLRQMLQVMDTVFPTR